MSRAGSASSTARSEGGLVAGASSSLASRRSAASSARSSGGTSDSRRRILPDEEDLYDEDDDADADGAGLLGTQDEDLLSTKLEDASLDDDSSEPDDIGDRTLSPNKVSDHLLNPSRSQAIGVQKSPSIRNAAGGLKDHMSLTSASGGNPYRSSAEVGALQKEVEELRAKVRILERKKEEDREKISEMEKAKAESDQFLALKAKLTTKSQELQSELRDLQKMEKDWAAQKDHFERQIEELTQDLEIATLDREMAEEKADAANHDLETLKLEVEELKINMEVLQEELAVFENAGDSPDADRGSIAYIQLEKQNERLKEALIRLRDVTSETEADQRRKVADLEKEIALMQDVQSDYENIAARLADAEAQVEDLKLQLDDNADARDMVEDLTERKQELEDEIKELRTAKEELEVLCELNVELEEGYAEDAKQLQQLVDKLELDLQEQSLLTETLKANVADNEGTFAQFRELVANLHADLETMRAEQAEARGENGEGRSDLASQSQAMLNLNMKLQSSALKSQAKTIELELGKLSASQAQSHLDMIKPYLPAAYFDADADAVHCLLFFQRMAYKADLIKSIVETNHDIQEALASVVPEHLVGVCQMRHSIAHFSALSRQIAAVLELAPVDVFLKAGRMYRENMAVEKKIDSYIEALRREELKEVDCGQEFSRFVKQFEDFSISLGGDENDSDLAAKEVGSATLIDHDLDTLIAALGFAKQSIAALYNDDEVEWDLGSRNLEEDVFDPLQKLIDNIKATKVPTRKVLRRLLSLSDNSEAVKMEAIINLPPLGRLTTQLVTFATQLSQEVAAYVADIKVSKSVFEITKIVDFIESATSEGLGKADVQIWSSPLQSTSHLSTTINSVLAAIVEQENVIRISGPGPWLARVEQIKAEASHNVEAERQIAKLSEDARDLFRQIKARDQALQESGIKVERLQKQLEKSKQQTEQMNEMKSGLSEVQKQAKAYQEANDSLQAELDTLQQANDRLKQQLAEGGAAKAGAAGSKGGEDRDGIDAAPMVSTSLETWYLADQVEALRGAVKFLRSENAYLKSVDLARQLHDLPPLASVGKLSASRASEEKEGEGAKIGEKEVGVPAVRKTRGLDIQAVSAEARKLHDQLCAMPKVVDLSKVTRAWQPIEQQPQMQYWSQRESKRRMADRIRTLEQRMRSLPQVALV